MRDAINAEAAHTGVEPAASGNMISLVRRGAGPVFYMISDDERAGEAAGLTDACIAVVRVNDWNGELSPWQAERCFRDGEDFGGGAGEYIARLTESIPAFERENGLEGRQRVICGYSLAGLCALYALYRTDMFSGAVSASGSMWFDGWLDFMEQTPFMTDAPVVYLSVGDREARTRNRRLASVEENTRRACGIFEARGAEAYFTLEPGNHFNDPHGRLARGMGRMAEMLRGKDGSSDG